MAQFNLCPPLNSIQARSQTVFKTWKETIKQIYASAFLYELLYDEASYKAFMDLQDTALKIYQIKSFNEHLLCIKKGAMQLADDNIVHEGCVDEVLRHFTKLRKELTECKAQYNNVSPILTQLNKNKPRYPFTAEMIKDLESKLQEIQKNYDDFKISKKPIIDTRRQCFSLVLKLINSAITKDDFIRNFSKIMEETSLDYHQLYLTDNDRRHVLFEKKGLEIIYNGIHLFQLLISEGHLDTLMDFAKNDAATWLFFSEIKTKEQTIMVSLFFYLKYGMVHNHIEKINTSKKQLSIETFKKFFSDFFKTTTKISLIEEFIENLAALQTTRKKEHLILPLYLTLHRKTTGDVPYPFNYDQFEGLSTFAQTSLIDIFNSFRNKRRKVSATS